VSEPKRYDFGMTVESCPTTGFHETRPWVYETEHGMYVKHADYAVLQAEVERLRKAGNAMLPFVASPPHEKGSHEAILNWQAAKEVQLTKHEDDTSRGLRRKTKRNLRKGVQS